MQRKSYSGFLSIPISNTMPRKYFIPFRCGQHTHITHAGKNEIMGEIPIIMNDNQIIPLTNWCRRIHKNSYNIINDNLKYCRGFAWTKKTKLLVILKEAIGFELQSSKITCLLTTMQNIHLFQCYWTLYRIFITVDPGSPNDVWAV